MKLGMTLPTMVPEMDPEALLGWSRRIDGAGFASLAVGERVSFPNLGALVALSAAAAVTERVRIVATVFVAPLHPTAWLAKRAASLDVLSGGRLVLGLGVGGREEDYRVVGVPFARRHARMDEQVDAPRRRAAVEALKPRCLAAGDGAVREAIRAVREAGADELILVPTGAEPEQLERLLDLLG